MPNRIAHFQIGLCLVAGFILAPLAAYFNGKSLPAQDPVPASTGKPPCDVRPNAEANACPTVSP